jgi:hypothetical protein
MVEVDHWHQQMHHWFEVNTVQGRTVVSEVSSLAEDQKKLFY